MTIYYVLCNLQQVEQNSIDIALDLFDLLSALLDVRSQRGVVVYCASNFSRQLLNERD
jgi:hypothetical protein